MFSIMTMVCHSLSSLFQAHLVLTLLEYNCSIFYGLGARGYVNPCRVWNLVKLIRLLGPLLSALQSSSSLVRCAICPDVQSISLSTSLLFSSFMYFTFVEPHSSSIAGRTCVHYRLLGRLRRTPTLTNPTLVWLLSSQSLLCLEAGGLPPVLPHH